MNHKHNRQEIDRLSRVLDSLHGFELIICGYQSESLYKEYLALTKSEAQSRGISSIDIDMSNWRGTLGFETFLYRSTQHLQGKLILNILGLNHHIDPFTQSTFLNQFNLIRDRIAEKYPFAFLLWLPEILISRVATDAPDLWAWRNTVFTFEAPQKPLLYETIFLELRPEKRFENLSLAEKQRYFQNLKEAESQFQKNTTSLPNKTKIVGALNELGYFYKFFGNYEEALNAYQQSFDINQELQTKIGLILNLNGIGLIHACKGDYKSAQNYLRKSSELAQQVERQEWMVSTLINVATIHYHQKDYEKALDVYRQISTELYDKQDQSTKAGILLNKAVVTAALGKPNEALSMMKESLDIYRELGFTHGEGVALANIGVTLIAGGDTKRGIEFLEQSLSHCRDTGDKVAEGIRSVNLALAWKELENMDAAGKYTDNARKMAKSIDHFLLKAAVQNLD